ncbi:MAG: DUF5681 domain-containing protein [Pseudomonadota bacterium]
MKIQLMQGVGYGNPPMETRFQKGRSGNPKGRPRKNAAKETSGSLLPSQQLVLDESKRGISVREGSETIEMEVVQALTRAQIAAALKGSPHAQKSILERIEKSEEAEAKRIALRNEAVRRYQKQKWAEMAEAKRRGNPMPEPVPHPDDIIIEDGKDPSFKGPMTEAETELVKEDCKLRDVMIMQNALDEREHIKGPNEDFSDGPGSAMIFALTIDRGLPERLKIDDTELILRTMKYNATPKRALLKQLTEGWRECGVKSRRGRTFPSARFARDSLSFAVDFVNAVTRGEFDVKSISRGHIDDRARTFLEDRKHLLSRVGTGMA